MAILVLVSMAMKARSRSRHAGQRGTYENSGNLVENVHGLLGCGVLVVFRHRGGFGCRALRGCMVGGNAVGETVDGGVTTLESSIHVQMIKTK